MSHRQHLIRQAEKNLVNICRAFDDFMEILNAMQRFGNSYIIKPTVRDEFFEGLQKMYRTVYQSHCMAIRDCFSFVGTGGDEAMKYSKEQFKKIFDEKERTCIMQFLDKYGRAPNSYQLKDEEEFRQQAKEIIENG